MIDKKIALELLRISIKNKSIIEDSWKGFAKKILPGEIQPTHIQYVEMRKAYYGGFYSSFDLMGLVSENFLEEEAFKILNDVRNQCENEIKKFGKWESIS